MIDYDYDAAGNLTRKSDYATSYDYSGPSGSNAVDRVTRVGGGTLSFSCDANCGVWHKKLRVDRPSE